MSNIQSKLKEIRKSLGKTQAQFAQEIGVIPSTIAKYESGIIKPGFDMLSKICKKYKNINMNWLLTGDGAPYTKGYKGLEIIPKRAQEAARRLELTKIADATADYSQEDELAMLREENERLRRALVALAQGKGESAQLPLAALAETIEMLQKSLDILQGIFGQAFPAEEDVK